MPRPSDKKTEIELKRLQILHDQQTKVRKRIQKEIRVKKGGYSLPGEILHKKNMAIFLKIGIPGISFLEIANKIGEPKGVVKKWFKEDADVKEFYEYSLNNLKQSALSLTETYGFEAVETLVLLMRFGSEKYMFEASNSILDRMGVIKATRQEIDAQNKSTHEWKDREQLVNEIRELPPEMQEQAVEALERFEELLARNSPDGKLKEDDDESEEIESEEFEEEEVDNNDD